MNTSILRDVSFPAADAVSFPHCECKFVRPFREGCSAVVEVESSKQLVVRVVRAC